MLPRIETYGNYSSSNYGAHCLRVHVGPLVVWFSYQTPVAYSLNGKRTVRENVWGPTTGKHLNAIDGGDKKNRVSGDYFQQLWELEVEPLLSRNQLTK